MQIVPRNTIDRQQLNAKDSSYLLCLVQQFELELENLELIKIKKNYICFLKTTKWHCSHESIRWSCYRASVCFYRQMVESKVRRRLNDLQGKPELFIKNILNL